jgi:hypothetical protein
MAKDSINSNNTSTTSSWCPRDGWNGLVPGVSKLSDAVNRFGKADSEIQFVNAKCYEFANKMVQVVLLNNESTLYKIRVFAEFPDKNLLPANIHDFEQVYGVMVQTEVDELATVTYEGDGLRVACQMFDNPQTVKWAEFYHPNHAT